MNEIVQILLAALGTIITGLCTLAVTKFSQWISTKIADKKAAGYLTNIVSITTNAVKETYQTYVEKLKEEGKFDKDAQKAALEACLNKIKHQLAPEAIDYITKNFGDMSDYLKSLIESTIYTLKVENK